MNHEVYYTTVNIRTLRNFRKYDLNEIIIVTHLILKSTRILSRLWIGITKSNYKYKYQSTDLYRHYHISIFSSSMFPLPSRLADFPLIEAFRRILSNMSYYNTIISTLRYPRKAFIIDVYGLTLMNMPQPATSDGARRRWTRSPRWILTF